VFAVSSSGYGRQFNVDNPQIRGKIVSILKLEISNDGKHRGQIIINRRTVGNYARVTPAIISLTQHFMPERRKVEAFIEKTYAEKFGAKLDSHYPYLMSARDASGEILAAIGFRLAKDEPLFLEHYLDQPIEQKISDNLGRTIARNEIAELGSLASQGHGATFFLFMVLADYLKSQGLSFATITGTRVLNRFFGHLGLDPRPLAKADKKRLPDQGTHWGSYYKTAPQVLFGDIAAGCRLLPVHYNGTQGIANDIQPENLVSRLHHPLTGVAL
jgi:Thermostable hemolysin